jgi:hypothetical protein
MFPSMGRILTETRLFRAVRDRDPSPEDTDTAIMLPVEISTRFDGEIVVGGQLCSW